MIPSSNLENKTTEDTYWRIQLVWKKFPAYSSLEPPLQSGPDAFDKSRFIMTFLTILGVTEILCSVKLVLEEKTGKKIPKSSRLEFSEKFSANILALSDVEDINTGLLNRGGIVDLLLLRTLLTIRQKSQEPGFWEVMDSFVLLAYISLAASRTLLQWLLACLNFTLESEDLSFWYKRKKRFLCELWQQHKQLKTMTLSEAWLDIFYEGYIH